MSKMNDFSGKVVLVSGSGSGIGKAIVQKLANFGADVVVTDIVEERVSSVAKDLQSNGFRALGVVADLTKEDDCKRVVEKTINIYGKLDLLVNCAGIVNISAIEEKSFINRMKNMFDINFYSAVYLTHFSAEYLAKTNGNIINITSTAAKQIVSLINLLYIYI